jgi:5' nucleotidase, deoxy (Pyrimidine), cytosolic type C protein (NT5C)
MQIYVDMDGVLADFDSHHEATFGVRSDKVADNVDWEAVRAVKGFYEAIPPMPDMFELWDHLAGHNPIVLTGVPAVVEEAADNKRAWVRRHLGPHVEVRCCKSKDKSLHAQPGDILIDDWEKYRPLWEAKGGVWITHYSARNTIVTLQGLGIDRR